MQDNQYAVIVGGHVFYTYDLESAQKMARRLLGWGNATIYQFVQSIEQTQGE